MRIPLRQYWALLVSYLRPQWPKALALVLLLLGSIGLQLFNPTILRRFIDTAVAGGSPRTLAGAAALFIGVALANQGLSVAATYTGESVGWSATNALRHDLALHCLRLDMSFHKAHTPGEMIERLDGDVTALASFFSQFVVYVAGNAILLLGVLRALAAVDWRAGAAFAVSSFAALVQRSPHAPGHTRTQRSTAHTMGTTSREGWPPNSPIRARVWSRPPVSG